MSNNNQPQVYITNVNMTMDQAGFDQADFDKWTSMSYLVDQGSSVTAGPGTTAIDNTWNVTVKVLYHGNDSSLNTYLINKASLLSIYDGSGGNSIKNVVQAAPGSPLSPTSQEWGNIEFSIEAVKEISENEVHVVKLGAADVEESAFFRGAYNGTKEVFKIIGHEVWTPTGFSVQDGASEYAIVFDGYEYAIMDVLHTNAPIVLYDNATTSPLTSVADNMPIDATYVADGNASSTHPLSTVFGFGGIGQWSISNDSVDAGNGNVLPVGFDNKRGVLAVMQDDSPMVLFDDTTNQPLAFSDVNELKPDFHSNIPLHGLHVLDEQGNTHLLSDLISAGSEETWSSTFFHVVKSWPDDRESLYPIMTDGQDFAIMRGTNPMVLFNRSTSQPLTSIINHSRIENVYVSDGEGGTELLSEAMSSVLADVIDDAVFGAQGPSIDLDVSDFGNTDPIIWNFSDSVLSVPANYGYDITELAAHSAYYLGELASLTEVVEFDLINFRSSPADDYLSVEGVGDGHFAYDRVDGIHFGSDVLVGEAGHLMILLGDYNDGQGMSASVINGRVDLTTTQGSISAEYVERLDGFNYNDVLSGDENRNLIAGVGGDDTIYGLGGDDVLGGRDGSDTIYGGSGNDKLFGDADDYGDSSGVTTFGNDILFGEEGNDILSGDGGNDTLDGGAGDDTISGGVGDDVGIYDGLGTDTFHFGSDSDTLRVSNITGFSEYRDGDDLVIYSSNGTDYARVVGAYAEESRLEYIEYTNTPDEEPYSILRLVSDINVVPESGVHFFAGTSGDDIIDGGTAETISVTGYDGNDTITGSPGADFIDGNSGDDQISGGDGNDILRGSAGDDTINDGEGTDFVDAGDGIDTYTRNFDPTQIFTENGQTWVPHIDLVNEGLYSPDYPDIVGDVLKNFENVIIEGQSDVIVTGDNIDNQITSGSGDDIISGGGGSDQIYAGDGDDDIHIELVDISPDAEDIIDGGGGSGDKLYLPGSSSDYSSQKIGEDATNKYRLYDSSLNPVATIENVEILEFDNGPSDPSSLTPYFSSMYDKYGLPEGDFEAWVDFHVNGTGNTAELVGMFTENSLSYYDLITMVTDLGGTVVDFPNQRSDDAETVTSVSGTAGTDVYLIDDYHVSASAGSDIFIMGMGSSGQNSFGLIQNVTYDNAGQVDLVASDLSADMDILSVAWLPDGVTVDANFGSVSHGSGGSGSDVYTDYFAGIEVFSLTDNDDYFAGGGPVDINWIDPGPGNDTIFGADSVFTVLDYSSDTNDFGVYIYNSDISSGIPIPGEANPKIVENGDQFDGAVIDDNGHIDVYTNVDYFVGSAADDTFIGGSGSDQFNAMWSDDNGDTFEGGDGDDTLIIENGFTNRGVYGDLYDMWGGGVSINDIDLDTIVVTEGTSPLTFHVTGTNVSTSKDIDVELTGVERIDIREYVEIATAGADNAELYVVDSYELLEGGQGDLGDMYYVTSLSHSTFDIHDGETPTYQILAEDTLLYDANIYYSGHHTDFDRSKNVVDWTALGTAAAASAATNNNENWQGHESIFFAWYDPDADGATEAYEIAVKYDDNDQMWRIANKAFDTFSNITLSAEDASTLNAMSHSIQQNASTAFEVDDTLRVYLGAAYQDITNVINSDHNVLAWDFSQAFTTSRSTYYVEIPNGTEATTQQVKVVYNSGTSAWELRPDEEILVNIPAFRVAIADDVSTEVDESASVVAGSAAAELISAGVGADTMLGGGGADTYAIGNGDADSELAPDAFGVVGDIINEVGGDIASTLGDSVNFTNIESIDNIFFDRSQIRFEKAESTLTITSNTDNGQAGISKDVVHIFDHFNEDLPFRQVEQLLLDEGWGLDQIWNLVADGLGEGNRDVLIGGSGDDTLVSGGGVDVMKGGAGQDKFVLGSSDVGIADIDTAHGKVTMIRDFVSADDSIDLSALDIADVSNVTTVQDSAGKTYVVSDTHVLAELMSTSDTTLADDDVILPVV